MPRIRSLKPEHKQHRKVGPLSDRDYRLWVGMITEADDEGRLVADAAQLRVLIFGYHLQVGVEKIEAGLILLAGLGLIRLYAVDGVRYADFPSWGDHQRINRPTPSSLPSYTDPGAVVTPHGALSDASVTAHSGAEWSGVERSGAERRGVERRGPGRKTGAMVDAEFVAALKANPAYAGIDFDLEDGKIEAWLLTPKGRGRKKTRGFYVNWLNRAERTMSPNGPVPSKPARPYGINTGPPPTPKEQLIDVHNLDQYRKAKP